MKRFEKLNALVITLTPEEKDFCHNCLKANSGLGEYELKNFQLFDLLQKQPEITEREAAEKLYGKAPKGSTFVRLQLCLLYKVLEMLSDEQKISREHLIFSRFHARLIARQRLKDADVLIARKLYFMASDLLRDIIVTAEKFELFDEQLSALALQENISRLQKEGANAADIVLKILEVRQRVSVIAAAAQLSDIVRQPEWFDVDERLKQLRQNAKEAPSATATFLLMDVEAVHMKEQCLYSAASELFRQQLTFALRHPALSDHYLTNEIYHQLAACAVYGRKYEKALEILMEAIHEQRLHPWQKEVIFIRFHALFYLKTYEEALRMTENGMISEHTALYHYWNAACYFMQKQYRKAVLCMQKVSFFDLVLHNCSAWPMFLLQMALIEEGALSKEKLKQELLKVRKRYTLNLLGREQKVDELMRQLIKYDFDFERTALKCHEQLTELKTHNDDFSFEIFSGELVVFHKWVVMKAKK